MAIAEHKSERRGKKITLEISRDKRRTTRERRRNKITMVKESE
jgi:hypothetical protein